MTARPLRRGNWSVQEMERLRQLMPRRGVADTALLLRRTESSVFKKAMQLLRVPPRRGAWTASDDGRLRECWGAVDPRLLAPMLGRPLVEVRKRVQELRARPRQGPWTREEVHALRDFYGTRSDDDLEVALARSRADVAAMAQSLCLAKDKRFAAQSARQVVAAGEGARRQEMPRWTPAQVERLQALYPDRDNLTVARELGRSVASVANKANQLGLRKCPQLLALIGRANVALRYREADATGG
ncbi:MAG: hypothetical protein JNK78_09375 [Planctomycetes bacterium]|nr:hypothetical protein [Planctomycetota bacterium]